MKRILLLLTVVTPFLLNAQAPCTINDGTGCVCDDGSSNCDLLPDITVAYDLLIDPDNNPEEPGELGVSVSTPNIGHGPLRVIATNYFVCGTDTIFDADGLSTCPDGSDPRQLIMQRIYQKDGNNMNYIDRWAGSMTYHQTHGHMHVDDWGVYQIREEVPGTDPLTWPIVAEGAKLGFCLMDYGTCEYYMGHCRDSANNTLNSSTLPNYGLGGGGYSCGLSNQGISAGWVDIYHYYLDGMQIPIPPEVCNGDYMIVVQVDPHNYFLEENENNNVTVAPITLTEQMDGTVATITTDIPTVLCDGEMVTLTANPGTEYMWSTGETSQSITVSAAGNYSVQVTNGCGTAQSDPVEITVTASSMPTSTLGDTVCVSGEAELTANGSGELYWYDAMTGGTMLGTGVNFTTPTITSTTSYYVANDNIIVGADYSVGPDDQLSSSLYNGDTYNGYQIFDAYTNITIKSVKVITDTEGGRVIELRDSDGNILESKNVLIPVGVSRVTLDFDVAPGTGYELGTNTNVNYTNLGFSSPRLQRSDENIAYPYEVTDVMSITESRAGEDYYYYFYDWEIKEADISCISDREEVVAVVDPCLGIEDLSDISMLTTYPNPTDGVFNVEFNVANSHDIVVSILDVTGKTMQSQELENFTGAYKNQFDLSDKANGFYLIQINVDGQPLNQKIIVQ